MGQTFNFLGKVWDIDAAMEILKKKPRASKMLDITQAMSLIRTDPKYVASIDLSKAPPIIVGTIKSKGEEFWLPLDGWHRIRKAKDLGLTELPAYILTKKETDRIVLEDRRFYR